MSSSKDYCLVCGSYITFWDACLRTFPKDVSGCLKNITKLRIAQCKLLNMRVLRDSQYE